MLKLIKKILCILFINIPLFVLLYIIMILPITFENNYHYNSIGVYSYYEKINIIDIPQKMKNLINNLELVDNEYITFYDKANFRINRHDFRKRAAGTISFTGNYKSNDDLKKFLLQLNISEKFEFLTKEHLLTIYRDNKNTLVSLYIENDNRLTIKYQTKLPYEINQNQEYDELQNYYLDKNYQNHLNLTNLIKQRFISICVILFILDIFVIIFYKFYKKNR